MGRRKGHTITMGALPHTAVVIYITTENGEKIPLIYGSYVDATFNMQRDLAVLMLAGIDVVTKDPFFAYDAKEMFKDMRKETLDAVVKRYREQKKKEEETKE